MKNYCIIDTSNQKITDKLNIYGMSYKGDYIEEIDNEEDYIRVSSEIKEFDIKENNII